MTIYNLIAAQTMSELVETLNHMNAKKLERATKENKDIYYPVSPASNIVYSGGYYQLLTKEDTE